MGRVVYIYGLREVGKEEFRYIGQTVSPKSRFKGHCKENSAGRKKCRWSESVLSRGGKLEMVIFEEASELTADEREKYWINRALTLNHRLTNRIYNYSTLFGNNEDHRIYGPLYPVVDVPAQIIVDAWIQGWNKQRQSGDTFNMGGLRRLATEQNMIDLLDKMVRKVSDNYPSFRPMTREEMKIVAEIL